MTLGHPRSGRIAAVMRMEWLHILRDRTTRALLVMVPVLQLCLFGYTVNLNPGGVAIAVAGDNWEPARDLIVATGRFHIVAAGLPPGGADRLLSAGKAAVAVELPPDAPDAEIQPATRIVVDAADPAAVQPALAVLQTAFLRRLVANDHLGGGPALDVEWRYNPDGRTAWAVIPGLAGAVVMISMLMLGALTLVRERERGTWDNLVIAPISAGEILVGKLLPYLLLGVLQGVVVVVLARLLFALPVRGSLLVFLAASALNALAYLAVGFAVSAVTRSQMQAMQAAVFLYLPSMLLSGFMFPFDGMPRWARILGDCLPLTHFVRAARDGLLRGADGRAAWEAAWLAGIAGICMAGAVVSFARQRR